MMNHSGPDLDANVVEENWDCCFNMNVKAHLWLFNVAKQYLEERNGSFISVANTPLVPLFIFEFVLRVSPADTVSF